MKFTPPAPPLLPQDELAARFSTAHSTLPNGIVLYHWRLEPNPEGHSTWPIPTHILAVCLGTQGFDLEMRFADTVCHSHMTPGAFSTLSANIGSSTRWSGTSNMLTLGIPPAQWAEISHEYRLGEATELPSGHFAPDSRLLSVAQLLAAELRHPAPNALYAESLTIAAYARMAQLQGGKLTRRSHALADWRLHRVIDYIHANLGNPLAVGDLAALAELSRSQFMESFRLALGMAPHQYVMRCRIDRACGLLHHSSASVTEIAITLGFSSHTHFSQTFRQQIGMSPREYRNATRGPRP